LHYKKLSAYIFIVGALVAILGTAFKARHGFEGADRLLLIVAGLTLGLLNKDHKAEFPFLAGSTAFIISSLALMPVLSNHPILNSISEILFNFIILIAPLSITIALRMIFAFLTQTDDERLTLKSHTYYDVPLTKFEIFWNHLLLLTVFIVFVLIVLQLLFDIEGYQTFITVIDYSVIAIFSIDLVFLYRKSKNLHDFIRNHWLDMVAVMPFGLIFQFTKIFRVSIIFKSIIKSDYIGGSFGLIRRSIRFLSKDPSINLGKRVITKSTAEQRRLKNKSARKRPSKTKRTKQLYRKH
jgi:hypothetical protein